MSKPPSQNTTANFIDQFLIGSHRNFTYLVVSGGEALVIDPQHDLAPWKARLHELGAELKGVLLTHTHWDHIEGVPEIVQEFGRSVHIYLHQLDAPRMARKSKDSPILTFVADSQKIILGEITMKVLHTPGHSAGECCYLVEAPAYIRIWNEPPGARPNDGPHLFTGDTVFVGEVGRTDLEGGSTAQLFETLQRLKKLPAGTMIYPGHHYGRTPTSTVARESTESAAFRCRTIEELDAIP